MSSVQLFLESNANKKIKVAVIGDSMLDEYFDVSVKRISPEFPIPIMRSEDELSQVKPGGAANVAYQFKNFNVDIDLYSFVDENAAAKLQACGVSTSNCLLIDNLIPRKRRFYSNNFAIIRWDIEQDNYGYSEEELNDLCFQLSEKIKQKISEYDVVIFSDYNKGVFNKFLCDLVANCTISIVDPKAGNPSRWKNCTIFKPNASEALALSGKKTLEDAGFFLLENVNCKSVVLTQGGDGISVFVDQKVFPIRPTHTLPPVESVIGAGDCAIAFLAMASARGFDCLEAANLAWQAGTIYVKNRYNKPIELKDIENLEDAAKAKIITNSDLQNFNNRNYKLVFTNGCFDILHAGHIENLKFAKKLGDKLIVAVNSDASVGENKPGRPINKLVDRMNMLASLEFVDYVVCFNEKTPLELIQIIRPDVLVKGSEYNAVDIIGYDLVPEVVTVPMYPNLSTTILVQKIKAAEF
jgi:D-beta-D-heptose 7-phosphate kinase/D-beta-D-heptose 1-phosphate adenosyltransferase